jgi:hypothetical protein
MMNTVSRLIAVYLAYSARLGTLNKIETTIWHQQEHFLKTLPMLISPLWTFWGWACGASVFDLMEDRGPQKEDVHTHFGSSPLALADMWYNLMTIRTIPESQLTKE